MNQVKLMVDQIFKSKVPKTATHFFHEGGYITFMKDWQRFKIRKMTAAEYEALKQTPLKPFNHWSLK